MGVVVLAFVEGVPAAGSPDAIEGVAEVVKELLGREVRVIKKVCPSSGEGAQALGIAAFKTPSGLDGLYIELYDTAVAPLREPVVQAVYADGTRVACRFVKGGRLGCGHADAVVNELIGRARGGRTLGSTLFYCVVNGHDVGRCCFLENTTPTR